MVLLSSCSAYKAPEFVIRHPDFYESKVSHDQLTVVADPFISEGKQVMLFNYNAARKGIYPVHLIFFNEGQKSYSLEGTRAQLVTSTGKRFQSLSEAEVNRLVGRNVAGRAAKFGFVGAILGTIAAPLTVLPAAAWGGVDTSKSNALSRHNIQEHTFKTNAIHPMSQSQGFLYYGLSESASFAELRLELIGLQELDGEQINFSLALPPLRSKY